MSQEIKIYKPVGAEGYELCQPVVSSNFKRISAEINGQPRREAWEAVAVKIFRSEDGRTLKRSDSPWLGSNALIFRPAAIVGLRDLLDACGEVLPLTCLEGDVSMFNPTHLLDGLDEDASSLSRFESGAIMMVMRYQFVQRVIEGFDIFKLSPLRVSPTFVSQKFVDRWNDCGLRGLDFIEVWSSGR